MKERIYLDYAATTPVLPEVTLEVTKALEILGNPSSLHAEGRQAKGLLQSARETIARAIGAEKDEIFFTSGGTEADHLAVAGLARARRKQGNHVITSAIEHSAVMGACRRLEAEGFEVTYLPVTPEGLVDPETFRNALRNETILATIMLANNEIGTLQPVAELSALAAERGIPFHTDAVQAFPTLPLHVKTLNIAALSLSAHKIYGPKGVGALYLKRGTPHEAESLAGSQERKVRPGTENLPGIAGFAKAVELLEACREEDVRKLLPLRNRLRDRLLSRIPDTLLNGHPETRLANNVNLCFRHADGEALLIHLDMEGISCSMGSACAAGALEPSHVLRALGRSVLEAKSSLRFTLGRFTRKEEINQVLELLPGVVERLRTISAASRLA